MKLEEDDVLADVAVDCGRALLLLDSSAELDACLLGLNGVILFGQDSFLLDMKILSPLHTRSAIFLRTSATIGDRASISPSAHTTVDEIS